MEEKMIIANKKLFEVLNGEKINIAEFLMIVKILDDVSYKITLSDGDYLNEIYEALYSKSKENEDIKIISKMFERVFTFIKKDEHVKSIEYLKELSNEEEHSFRKILEQSNLMRRDDGIIGYNINEFSSIRNISTIEELKKILLIFCNEINEKDKFIEKIKKILFSLKFDDDIVGTMEHLNNGFVNRRKEIIYHLFCIDKEIPVIMDKNPSGYKEIGELMTISCTPERDRRVVETHLTKNINQVDVNCELHTKMKILTSKAPDRIYFCPSMPEMVGDDAGRTYIYKITKHV